MRCSSCFQLLCQLILIDATKIIRPANGKVNLPLPICLDNTLRLQFAPPSSPSDISDTGEMDDITIETDPKLLPLPPHAFTAASEQIMASRRGVDRRDSWEDGETSESDGEVLGMGMGDEEDGCWFEGRFKGYVLLLQPVRSVLAEEGEPHWCG